MTVSGERFQLLERLGSGGAGEVHRAFDRDLGRLVALKLLRGPASDEAGARRLLLDEARAAACLRHPGVAAILDVTRTNGRWCIVMELVGGGSLDHRLARGPMPVAEAVEIAVELAETLQAAHSQGCVHGDVKPSNVLLTEAGRPKLVDFGLARACPSSATYGQEAVAGFGGTPGYAPPEQVRGQPAEPGMDVFSLGATLYEMLIGGPPFDAPSPALAIKRVLEDEPAPLAAASHRVPLELERIVRKALAKDPRQRYASVESLRGDLVRARASLDLGLRSEGRAGADGAPATGAPAFRGLLPFHEADRDAFFGREADLGSLVQRVTQRDFRFGVLYGDSGCGKTSLLRAGLVPELWQRGELPLYCRPLGDPLQALLDECGKRIRAARHDDEPPFEYLARVAAQEPGRVFLLFDPFEEFFVSVREPQARQPFLSLLAQCHARSDLGIRCLVSIRSDFLHLVGSELAGFIPEPLAMAGLHRLGNLDEDRAREVIDRSARRSGLELEPGLVQHLASDLASGGAVLPSELQIVGERLESRRLLSLRDYRRAGGKEALVFSFVDDVVRASGDARAAGLVLRTLISEEDTRLTLAAGEIVRRSQLPAQSVERLLARFVESRLVRELREEEPARYELVHEYLIGKVNQVAGRVLDATQRANRLLRQYLSAQAADSRTRIPLRHAWFISRYAEAAKGKTEKELLRRSLRAGLARATLAAIGLAAGMTAVAAALSVTEEWDERRLRDGHTTAARRVVFSPDGRRLVSGGEDGKVIVWDFARRQKLATLTDHEGWVSAVAYSPDGRHFATAGIDRWVRLWDAQSFVLVASRASDTQVRALAFSLDGRFLAAADEARTLLWSTPGLEKARELPRNANSLVFSPRHPETLFSSNAWAWRLGGSWTWSLQAGDEPVVAGIPVGNAIAVSPDGGRLAAIDSLGYVTFADPSGVRPTRRYRAHRFHGRSVAFSPDGRLFASAAEDVVLWDAKTETKLSRLEHTAEAWSVDFSPDARWLVVGYADGDILVWDARERERLASFSDHHASVRSVAFSSDGRRLASASEDRSVVLWDVERGAKQAVLVGPAARINAVAWLPDGSGLATCDLDGTLILWDVATRSPRWTRPAVKPVRACYAVAVSPDGRLVASSVDVREIAGGREVVLPESLAAGLGAVYGLAFSPDGRRLACAIENGFLLLWDATQWKLLARRPTPGTHPITAALSPDGRFLATGGDEGDLRLWDARSLDPLGVVGRHPARLKSVAFSPDSRYVASASDDRTIALWDVSSRSLVTRIGSHTAPVLSVAFSPDGRRLASGGHDRSVRLVTRHRALWGHRLD
jgi:WD40 repeat protein